MLHGESVQRSESSCHSSGWESRQQNVGIFRRPVCAIVPPDKGRREQLLNARKFRHNPYAEQVELLALFDR